ncbi:hypothetical protein FisN_5Lh483 [Fistulifera solaris]|uniref:PDZ domain-containing protein n=1 Tax=Fistulifera solaris TaxID=1519565 RepID=A0A1Z5KGQ4_FISSO|nr:hypothetical protein FisN_5Lh483 [Fistulifera solaris]|eukprot:GAX25386.1 hypothetical protein FisN_5Lh483 [Fistulifera solaris]
MQPDPPGRIRSDSYDKSFRPQDASLEVLNVKAADAPLPLQYDGDEGPFDAPPTKVLTPQSDDSSPMSHMAPGGQQQQTLHPRKLEEFEEDVGAEKPSALPMKENRLIQAATFTGITSHESGDEIPFDEGNVTEANTTKVPVDRFYLPGPRIAAPRRIESNDFLKDLDESSIDGAPAQNEGNFEIASQRGVDKKGEKDDDSLFDFEERQESSTTSNTIGSVSNRKPTAHTNNKQNGGLDTSTAQEYQAIHSSYSKSAESEVDDLINDILLLGSDNRPGKRTGATNDRSETGTPNTSDNHQGGDDVALTKEGDGQDPITSVWNYLFDGGKSKDESEEAENSLAATLVTCPSAAGELFDYASELFLGGDSKASNDKLNNGNVTSRTVDTATALKSSELAPCLDEDLRLVELAIEAARSLHRLRGCMFDDTHEIDFSRDIKFTVVDLELPLGLIFQEHRIGCWVTKVLPTGSAATNGKVQIGDQLAAIDGKSAINMTVGDVAALVRDKIASVELTFMRYVGPLRPTLGGVSEEGYEINAKSLVNRNVNSQPSSPVRQNNSSQPKFDSPTSMQTVASPEDTNFSAKYMSGEQDKRRFRLFGKRKSDS